MLRPADLPDERAPGLPDVPFSAYCKKCWEPVYCLWVDEHPHDGSCPNEQINGYCPRAGRLNT